MSTEPTDVISQYGKILGQRRHSAARVSDLPYAQGIIRAAILLELLSKANQGSNDALRIGFIELDSFLSDDEFEVIRMFEDSVAQGAHLSENDAQSLREIAFEISTCDDEAIALMRRIAFAQQQSELFLTAILDGCSRD
jgi:hypothetical protein